MSKKGRGVELKVVPPPENKVEERAEAHCDPYFPEREPGNAKPEEKKEEPKAEAFVMVSRLSDGKINVAWGGDKLSLYGIGPLLQDGVRVVQQLAAKPPEEKKE